MDNLEKISAGKPITARFLNRLVDAIRANRVSSDGSIVVTRSIGGTVLRLASWALGVSVAKSGGSGIPARSTDTPGSGAITLYGFNGTSYVAGSADTALNVSSTAVGASKYLIVVKIYGRWHVIVESCA